ncbi:hypothetical protein RLIN73S_04688 [Rhodanobacter lindaniclasticus]
MRQSGDLVQCSLIAAQQLLQRLAGDRRRVRVVGQRGVVHRAGDQVVVQRGVVLDVQLLLALLHLVQRRQADVDVAALDQLRHLPVEEGQQQGADMRAVDIRVSHQDDAVIAQLVGVVLVLADAGAQRGDQGTDLGRGQHAVEAGLLDVEDLALQRQHGLGLAVAALLGRAAGGVTLDQEQFAQRRVLLLAVGQLARKAGDVQRALATGHLARLARGLAGARGVDRLGGDRLGLIRVFQQELAELLVDRLLHRGLHLGGDQLVLGLRGELRVGHLHRQHRDHAFAHVVAGQGHLGVPGQAFLLDVVLQRAGQRRAETGEVGAAVALRDVVGEAEHGLVVGVGPLHRHLHHDAILIGSQADHVRVQRGFQLGQMLHERADAALVGKRVLPPLPALVLQFDGHARVEEGQFTQALGQDLVVEVDVVGERGRAGQEAHDGAAAARRANLLQRKQRFPERVFLLVLVTVAMNGQPQVLAQRVHHRDAHAVQATGDLVGVGVELAARMQHRHHHLGGGAVLLGMHVHRDATTIVGHADRAILVDRDQDLVAVAGQRLVDRVVDDLEHHVVQTGAVIGVADVHPRALAHRFQALQDLDVAGVVMRFVDGFVHALTVSWRQRPARHGAMKGRTGLCTS